MPWSRRTPAPGQLQANRLAVACQQRRVQGRSILDLTASNPTTVDLINHAGLQAFSAVTPSRYAPHPLGPAAARAGVAAYYQREHQVAVDPARIVLTASTSESYSCLFKLLADPGDEVLVPVPSYPLLDSLLRLDGLVAVPYSLRYDGGWQDGSWSIAMDTVANGISSRTRAILVVHPNNPTGHYVSSPEWDQLVGLARERDLALVSDEVFADYGSEDPHATPLASTVKEAMVFSLSGLSKVCALPQLKLGWIVVSEHPEIAETMARLEFVNDAYLSASTATLNAAADILRSTAGIQETLRHRLRANEKRAAEIHRSQSLWNPLPREGGWYLVLRVPHIAPDEEIALQLLSDEGVYVHPGSFFGFGGGRAHLVISLLTPPDVFSAGLERIDRSFVSATDEN